MLTMTTIFRFQCIHNKVKTNEITRDAMSNWTDIQTDRGFQGSYKVKNGVITVKSGEQYKTANLGNVFPKTLAVMLLFEIERGL